MGRWVWAPTVSGPLAGHATGFERWLRTRGFSGSAVSHRIWQFDHLSRWLDREGLRLDQLTPGAPGAVPRGPARGWVSDVGVGAELEGAACVSA